MTRTAPETSTPAKKITEIKNASRLKAIAAPIRQIAKAAEKTSEIQLFIIAIRISPHFQKHFPVLHDSIVLTKGKYIVNGV